MLQSLSRWTSKLIEKGATARPDLRVRSAHSTLATATKNASGLSKESYSRVLEIRDEILGVPIICKLLSKALRAREHIKGEHGLPSTRSEKK